ncbi:hypothetical protein LPJ81_000401 [Coemansia sp. IMI 209127]|nr:hypothetical protein LPJ81_000401 [Coemansia sp. IMI 209127]
MPLKHLRRCRHCYSIAQYIRGQFRDLRKCESQEALDSMWGDILVHRLTLQEHCEDLIISSPKAAEQAAADKILWKYVYYDAILECRKRLRLHVPLYELSQSMSSLSGSIRESDGTASSEGSVGRSAWSTSSSANPAMLEEWWREWWAMTLTTLFNEALGYFQTLLSRVLAQLRDRSTLDYSLAYIKGSEYRFPRSYLIARRLYLNIGDIYRYQCMYMPQLSAHSSGIGAIDTCGLTDMAQATYCRARAMHIDSGSACIRLALLAASAHSRFDVVFWQMCGLCYEDSAMLRGRRVADVATSDADAGHCNSSDDYDHIEDLVIRLAQTVVQQQASGISSSDCNTLGINGHSTLNADGSLLDSRDNTSSSNTVRASGSKDDVGNPVDSIYHALLDALNEDLDEAQNCDVPLHLDTDFWSREFQLSAILAALLTAVAYGSSGSDSGVLLSTEPTQTAMHMYMIQHLAAILLLRQMLCLQQTLELNGFENEEDGEHVACTAYPLMSLALWVDIWRSGPHLSSLLDGKLGVVDMGPGLSDSLKRLFSCLLLLIRGYSDLDMIGRHSSDMHSDLANMVLPHDVSLMGWMSLRPVQKKLRYGSLGEMPVTFSTLARCLMPNATTRLSTVSVNVMDTQAPGSLLGVWQDARKMLRVVFARTQILMASMALDSPNAVISWSGEHDEFVVGELEVKENSVYHLEQHKQTESVVFATKKIESVVNASISNNNSNNKGIGGCPSSRSSSMSSLGIVPEEELVKGYESQAVVVYSGIARPLYVPDIDVWLDHLPLIQKMLLSRQCVVVLPSVVHGHLLELVETAQSEYRARTALNFISSQTAPPSSNQDSDAHALLIQNPDETLAQWEDVCDYYVIGLDEIDEYELPSIAEVADDMRGVIMSTLYLAHVKYPGENVAIVTDSDELEFYASWFGIERESSAAVLTMLA